MALVTISETDRRVIFECLTAAAHGPFFNDADLRILLGLDRSDLLGIVARIPWLDYSEPNVRRAIGYTFLNLLRYPHGKNAEWANWISVSRGDVEEVDARWAALLPPIVYESFEVFGPTCFGGRYYRVVEYRMRGGGRGWGCEVWSSGRWLCPRSSPGGNEIMAAVPTAIEELLRAGVDCSPIPINYDPFSVECEGDNDERSAAPDQTSM